jgi:hypothetical protein
MAWVSDIVRHNQPRIPAGFFDFGAIRKQIALKSRTVDAA